MKAFDLRIEAINVGGRLRPLSEPAVLELMESIRKIGLQEPIIIWRPGGMSPKLVAGRHRMEASRRLGHETIACVDGQYGTADEARLAEIAENLHRADLKALERDEHIAEWIRITAAQQVVTDKLSETREGRPGIPKSVVTELAVNAKAAQRAIKVDGLSDETKAAARAAGLDDNQSALLRAAKHTTPAAQIEALQVKEWEDVEAKQRRSLQNAWNRASPNVRSWFRENIMDAPVMDRRYANA